MNDSKQTLRFFISDEFDGSLVKHVSGLLEELAGAREWTVRPPELVDEVQEPEDPTVDLPVRTLRENPPQSRSA